MDLFQSLILPPDGNKQYRATEIETFPLASSQASIAAPSSSVRGGFSSQPPSMSAEGFSVSQSIPDGLDPLSVMERAPSCGQDHTGPPPSGQRPSLSVRTLAQRDGFPMQDENGRPGLQPHNNIDDVMDDFSDATCSPLVQSLEAWEKSNPDTRPPPKPKMESVTVARSKGTWKTQLQHWCDQSGVRPEIDIAEPVKQQFVATLKVNGLHLMNAVPQSSKKLAQEDVCQIALSSLPPSEAMVGVEREKKQSKKRKSDDANLDQLRAAKGDRSENWIGLLNEHAQQTKSHSPEYEDVRVEGAFQRLRATVVIAERPNEPFGTGDQDFASKKDARSAAAKLAVLWLRERGHQLEPSGKRQQQASDENTVSVDRNGTDSKSLPAQIHQLAIELGLKVQPKWVSKPSTPSSGQALTQSTPFIDMHAEFDGRDSMVEPALRGSVGQVRHCFGQKQAKEQCCREVIHVLQQIRAKRLSMA